MGGYFPFFLQMACCTVFENYPDLDNVRARFYEQAVGHFVYVWDHLTEREKITCSRISEHRALNEQDRSFVGALIRRGYVYSNGSDVRLFSDVFDDFVRSKTIEASSSSPVSWGETTATWSETTDTPLTLGSELAGRTGRYSIREVLGSGGMGEVYLAHDTKLKRLVALKRIARHLRDKPGYCRRLLNEAERASQLNHRGIVRIYDVLEENTDVFIIMEYVQGQTLRTRTASVRLDEFLNIARQCAEALSVAHEKRIVHCDIKPENILLTPEGDVKILDFGVAKYLPDVETPNGTRALGDTMTKVICGPRRTWRRKV
jgi:predicted Ser/Thr protein kinase